MYSDTCTWKVCAPENVKETGANFNDIKSLKGGGSDSNVVGKHFAEELFLFHKDKPMCTA